MEEDQSNPWPSFVDSFSIVICIFIFMILLVTINNLIISFESSLKRYSKLGPDISSQSLQKNSPIEAEKAGEGELKGVAPKPEKGARGAQLASEDNTGSHHAGDNQPIANTNSALLAQEPVAAQAQGGGQTQAAQSGLEGAQAEEVAKAQIGQEVQEGRDRQEGEERQSGVDSGQFDITKKSEVTIVEQDNVLSIKYSGIPRIFSAQAIEQIVAWLAKQSKTGVDFTMDIKIRQGDLAFSDVLRLGYEQGIFMIKAVKNQNKDININIVISIENSLVMNETKIYRLGSDGSNE